MLKLVLPTDEVGSCTKEWLPLHTQLSAVSPTYQRRSLMPNQVAVKRSILERLALDAFRSVTASNHSSLSRPMHLLRHGAQVYMRSHLQAGLRKAASYAPTARTSGPNHPH